MTAPTPPTVPSNDPLKGISAAPQAPSVWTDVRTLGAVLGMAVALFSGYVSTVKSGEATKSATDAVEASRFVTTEKGAIFKEVLEATRDTQREGKQDFEAWKKRVEALERQVKELETERGAP